VNQRLSQAKFTDIILSEDSGDEVFLTHVPGEGELVLAGDELRDDIAGLRELVIKNSVEDYSLTYDGIPYRGARLQSVDGVFHVLRRGMRTIPTLKELGFIDQVGAELLGSTVSRGLVVFCGVTGSGKTLSASAMLTQRLALHGGHAVTIEDPAELPLHGAHGKGRCYQTEAPNGEFGRALKRALRYNPRIILLGELREAMDVSQALRAAINGHLIIATLHAGGIEEALGRILAMSREYDGGLAGSLLADGIAAVIHQQLVGDPKKLRTKQLIVPPERGDPVRAKIRDEKIHMLGTDIQAQHNRMMMGSGGR